MLLSFSVFHLICIITFLPRVFVYSKDVGALCSTCRQLTDSFAKGLERTAKQNFGGGNTEWEETRLSRYEASEIRLTEILDDLCSSSSFECTRMLEENEEHLETWWFRRKSKRPELFKWFCVDTIKVCCPNGSFGLDCNTCVGGSDRPCHENGKCDGEGTRGGSGKCVCHKGYEGELCLDCTDGYYSELRNDTFSLCKECHKSCSGCVGKGNEDCKDCRKGWEKNQEGACADIDECSKEASPCAERQYCHNTEGSFSCKECHESCRGCFGKTFGDCKECQDGWEKNQEGVCADIDECSRDPVPCEENQYCLNTEGSFSCEEEKKEELPLNSNDDQPSESLPNHEDL